MRSPKLWAWLLVFSVLPAAAFPTATVADCTAPVVQTLVAPPAAAPGAVARALWLDGRRLRWPGQPEEGVLRLHHAGQGALSLSDAGTVQGSDGAWTLRPAPQPLAPAEAQRFRWFGTGREAVLPPGTDLRPLLRGDLLLTREDAQGRVLAHTRVQHAAALDALYPRAETAPGLGGLIIRSFSNKWVIYNS